MISGKALIFAMDASTDLSYLITKIGDKCDAVLACRVSPKQKQEVVSLVRKEKPTVRTLAIGDGANDVNMIVAAHVGVGIRGVEGQQAARASDYAIGEFKLLRRLLLHEGRESYRKISQLILYNFYKNVLVVTPHFFYGFYCMFTGHILYDPWIFQFYNMFFAAAPIMVYALFDQEENITETLVRMRLKPMSQLEKDCRMYRPGLKSELYGNYQMVKAILNGAWQALIITFFTFPAFPFISDFSSLI